MVVLLDLDGDEYTLDLLGHRREDVPFPHPRFGSTVTRNGKKTSREGEGLESDRPNLNINGFSAALNCYPLSKPTWMSFFSLQLADYVDVASCPSLRALWTSIPYMPYPGHAASFAATSWFPASS